MSNEKVDVDLLTRVVDHHELNCWSDSAQDAYRNVQDWLTSPDALRDEPKRLGITKGEDNV